MKFSENWLREWVNPDLTTSELVEQLTMAGLEVDAVDPAAGEFHGVVVARVVSLAPHPDADKLKICQVDTGSSKTVQVVCGASNVREGFKAPFAQVGAVLPGNFTIKKAKLRGVESSGMLCGASELGMEDLVDGLMALPDDAPVGASLRDYLGLEDTVLDVDLTPNRGDCLSIQGIARDLGALNGMAVKAVKIDAIDALIDETFPVRVEAQNDCPSYIGRVIRHVDVNRPVPLWLTEKLRRSGIRSIDPIVDITNYVMLELGQPMHAFDLNRLNKEIIVRRAQDNESLTLLDGQELTLSAENLVIADDSGPLALAGIMGGEGSGISTETTDIFLESAFFDPVKLAGKARAFGLHTDSSHRFERGVDSELQAKAIERATALILDITGGKPGPIVSIESGYERVSTVSLTRAKLDQLLGLSIAATAVEAILTGLGLSVEPTACGWQCGIPGHRFDLTIEADLIEEIARVYGYNNLPVSELRLPVGFQPAPEAVTPLQSICAQLVALGYQEAITYSFTDPDSQRWFTDEESIAITNPISSEMSVMRNSLLPGLIQALQYNLNRQQSHVRLFESGLTFNPGSGDYQQLPMIAGLVYGKRQPESWANSVVASDFFDIKGDVESLLAIMGIKGAEFRASTSKGYHPGQSAEVIISGQSVGFLGAVHPQLIKTLGITDSVFVFELSLDILNAGNVSNFKAVSRFPSVRRDLAFIVDETLESCALIGLVKKKAGEYLKECILFDLYAGIGVEKGKKSLALGLVFQHPDRSLNDEEVQSVIQKITDELAHTYGAFLRN